MNAFGHVLPPRETWPDFLPVPGMDYPEFMNAAVELLDRNVQQGRGPHLAIRSRREELTYAEVLDRVRRLTSALAQIGVQRGDRVLLRLPNSPEFIIAWLSIVRLGAVVVATVPLLRAAELKAIVDDARVRLAICQDSLLEDLEKVLPDSSLTDVVVTRSRARKFHYFEDCLNFSPSDQYARTLSDDIAIIAYTSGSTGIPKGTIHFHRDIMAIADTYARFVLEPRPDDVFGGHPSLAFTFGLGGLFIFPFRFGASTVLLERFSPRELLASFRDFKVTIAFCAPTSYKMMLDECGDEIGDYVSHLRLCVSAGETLPGSVFTRWADRTGLTILDGIGSTEMLHIFISNRPEDARPQCTGRPVPGYEARVVNDQLKELPPGTPGMLAVRGPTGCRYWNRPEQQRSYVREGWNLPGDIFVRDEEGYFHYCCRHDDLIICGGYNIAGPEVENALLQHPAVSEVAVVASPDELRGWVPKAFIVLAEGYSADEALARELKEFVKQTIAPYKYPRRIEFVHALPRTATGKIRRAELRRREGERTRS